jgi:hypothetical protein
MFDSGGVSLSEGVAEGVQFWRVFSDFILKPCKNLLRKNPADLLIGDGNDSFIKFFCSRALSFQTICIKNRKPL